MEHGGGQMKAGQLMNQGKTPDGLLKPRHLALDAPCGLMKPRRLAHQTPHEAKTPCTSSLEDLSKC